MNQPSRADGRLEIATTLLLAVAAVATAWSAYEARQWTGEQAQAYASANASRVESTRAGAVADRQAQIDVATFIQWVDANQQQDRELAAFYRERFRDEFKPAFAAWAATKPLTRPDAPETPFAMPEYKLASATQATRLENAATGLADEAKEHNQRADNYMLGSVLLAASLFFAGISTRLRTDVARRAILVLGWVMFAGTVVWLATLPAMVTT